MQATEFAGLNFDRHVRSNSYPGRGLVIGRSSVEDTWLMVYWIMGRSANSRNRRFAVEGGSLRTEPVDLKLVTDPGLIIYEAMMELPGIYIVSNGDQTRTLFEALQVGGTFDAALARREREPDAPNYTPRISAMLDLQGRSAEVTLSILRANPVNPEYTDRFTYRPAPPPPGLGLCLTTYRGDGTPLPSFWGEPLLVPCAGSAEEVLDAYWDALDTSNRISIAIKQVRSPDHASEIIVRNRYGE